MRGWAEGHPVGATAALFAISGAVVWAGGGGVYEWACVSTGAVIGAAIAIDIVTGGLRR